MSERESKYGKAAKAAQATGHVHRIATQCEDCKDTFDKVYMEARTLCVSCLDRLLWIESAAEARAEALQRAVKVAA